MTESQLTGQSHRNSGRERSTEAVDLFCRDLVSKLQLDLSVEVTQEGESIRVNLTGPDRSYLLSNTAALLNGMEYLVNRVFRAGKEEAAGIVFDSDHYRQHREAELILLAQMASEKVTALRKPLTLQPMSPRERRIVHLALADRNGVHTQSEGEGDNRSVTIYPS